MATLLVYTIAPYVPFTKILSASINQDKTDIKNRINWGGGTDTTTGLSNDNIQSNTAGSETVASLTLQGVTYTATAGRGAGGNSITVRYTTGAIAGSEVVSVIGLAITIQVSSGVSTVTQVRTAVNASLYAAGLVTATGTSSSTISAVSATALSGGVDGGGLVRSTKLALGPINTVVINDSTGKMSSTTVLPANMGGTGSILVPTDPGDVVQVDSNLSLVLGAPPTPAANRVFNFYQFV